MDPVVFPLGPAPCDECPRAARCAERHLACSAFALFARGRSRARWSLAPRTDASAEQFSRIFALEGPPRDRRPSVEQSAQL